MLYFQHVTPVKLPIGTAIACQRLQHVQKCGIKAISKMSKAGIRTRCWRECVKYQIQPSSPLPDTGGSSLIPR